MGREQAEAASVKSSGEGSEHTPGPWRLADIHAMGMYPNDGSIVILGADQGEPVSVANVAARAPFKRGQGHALANDAERDANARLIAAAPELLEALKGLMNHCGIAEAAPEDKDGEDHRLEYAARAAIAKAEGRS